MRFAPAWLTEAASRAAAEEDEQAMKIEDAKKIVGQMRVWFEQCVDADIARALEQAAAIVNDAQDPDGVMSAALWGEAARRLRANQDAFEEAQRSHAEELSKLNDQLYDLEQMITRIRSAS